MKEERIVAIRKDNIGRVVEYKTDSGRIYDAEMAKEAIDLNIISNASTYQSRDGTRKIMLKKENIEHIDINTLPEF